MLVDGTCRSKVTEVIVSVKAILTEIASAVAASDSVNQITTGLMSLIAIKTKSKSFQEEKRQNPKAEFR